MFEISKVLNHNAIVVLKNDQEYLIMEKGIGFGKKAGEKINLSETAILYKLQKENERNASIDKINPIFLEITHELLEYAQKTLGDIDPNILLPLSDHIAFAIERIRNNLVISNPFANEIRVMNPEEYQAAKQVKKIIYDRLGIEINDDEIGYITLHLHSARSNEKVDEGMQAAIIINESIKLIEDTFQTHINVYSLAYSRLLTHMKYMLIRIKTDEKLNLDMDDYVQSRFPRAYDVAEKILLRVGKELHHTIPRIEIGYLGLHIQRICDINPKESLAD